MIERNRIVIETRLGIGKFGEVFKCRMKSDNEDGIEINVAIKVINSQGNNRYFDFLISNYQKLFCLRC